MSVNDVVRFAVCDDADRRSGPWRVFFDDSSVYVAARSLGSDFKVSIHYPRPGAPTTLRYAGYTREKAVKLGWPEPIKRVDRTASEWRGWEFAPGYFHEYAVRFLPSELRRFALADDRDLYWLALERADHAIEVVVLSAPSHHEGLCPSKADGTPIEILHEVELPGLRRIWIVAHAVPLPTPAEIEEWREYARFMLPHFPVEPHSRLMVDLQTEYGAAYCVDMAAEE